MLRLCILPCLLAVSLFAGEEYDHRLPDGQGMRMIAIPAGEFRMGGEENADERPVHRVRLGAYDIGKHEVTNRQYLGFCRATGRAVPPAPAWGVEDELPVVNVGWVDAAAFCEWAGLQLPTEAQWEYAARGSDERRYPWGNEEPDGGQCNYADASLAGVEAGDYIDKTHSDGQVRTAPVGSYSRGASPFGAMDMAGNVWEWCADWYDVLWYEQCGDGAKDPECANPAGGARRVSRGGCWGGTPKSLRVATRLGCEPGVRSRLLGFRVASRSTMPADVPRSSVAHRDTRPPAGEELRRSAESAIARIVVLIREMSGEIERLEERSSQRAEKAEALRALQADEERARALMEEIERLGAGSSQGREKEEELVRILDLSTPPDGPSPGGTMLAEATVGPEGGRIEAPGQVLIEIPAGAIEGSERIAVRPLTGPSDGVMLYDVERSSKEHDFSRPVRVCFTLPEGVDGEKAFTAQPIGDGWFCVSPGQFDSAKRTLSFEVTHFSAVGWMSTLSGETLARLKFILKDEVVAGIVVVGVDLGSHVVLGAGAITMGHAGIVVVGVAAYGWATGVEREMAEKVEGFEGPLPIGSFRLYWKLDRWATYKGTFARFDAAGKFLGFDKVKRDASGRLVRTAFDGSAAGVRFVPAPILALSDQLQEVDAWYRYAGIGGREPIVVRVHENLQVKEGRPNLGEWDGLTLNVLDSVVADAANPASGTEGAEVMQTTVAHEFWHAICAERRQSIDGYGEPFPGFEEAAAVGFESLQVPMWEKFAKEQFGWIQVARMLRFGLLVPSEKEGWEEEDGPSRRGYCLWPFAKLAFHEEGGAKKIHALAGHTVTEQELDRMFDHLVSAILTREKSLPDFANVRLPNASTVLPAMDCFTGWSELDLMHFIEGGKNLALGKNPVPASRPLSMRCAFVNVFAPDARVPGGPLLVRRKAQADNEWWIGFQPVSLTTEWKPAEKAADLQRSPSGLVIPKEQVDEKVILPFAVVGYRHVDPDRESPVLAYRLVPPILKSVKVGSDPDSEEARLLVEFEPIPPGRGLDPEECLAGYRLVGRRTGETALATLAEILYTTDHLSDEEKTAWYTGGVATKVEIEPGATTALLPLDTTSGLPEIGLQAIEGCLKSNGRPLVSEPFFVGWVPMVPIDVYVGWKVEEVKRVLKEGEVWIESPNANPFDDEGPIADEEVAWSFTKDGSTIRGSGRTNAFGNLRIPSVPLDTPVTISAHGETKSVTCIGQQPPPLVAFIVSIRSEDREAGAPADPLESQPEAEAPPPPALERKREEGAEPARTGIEPPVEVTGMFTGTFKGKAGSGTISFRVVGTRVEGSIVAMGVVAPLAGTFDSATGALEASVDHTEPVINEKGEVWRTVKMHADVVGTHDRGSFSGTYSYRDDGWTGQDAGDWSAGR